MHYKLDIYPYLEVFFTSLGCFVKGRQKYFQIWIYKYICPIKGLGIFFFRWPRFSVEGLVDFSFCLGPSNKDVYSTRKLFVVEYVLL
jgi:hypothetical protein